MTIGLGFVRLLHLFGRLGLGPRLRRNGQSKHYQQMPMMRQCNDPFPMCHAGQHFPKYVRLRWGWTGTTGRRIKHADPCSVPWRLSAVLLCLGRRRPQRFAFATMERRDYRSGGPFLPRCLLVRANDTLRSDRRNAKPRAAFAVAPRALVC